MFIPADQEPFYQNRLLFGKEFVDQVQSRDIGFHFRERPFWAGRIAAAIVCGLNQFGQRFLKTDTSCLGQKTAASSARRSLVTRRSMT